MAIQRAEDKTATMQARAGAIDELLASGALDDATSLNRGDDISRELDAMSSQADVEAQLAALKGGGRPAGELPAGTGTSESQPVLRDREGAGPGMIVRILGEGQYDVADDALDRLNSSTPPSRPRSRPTTRTPSAPRSPRCSTACAPSARRTPPTASTSPTSSSRPPTAPSPRSATCSPTTA